jgi:hypothetical protein
MTVRIIQKFARMQKTTMSWQMSLPHRLERSGSDEVIASGRHMSTARRMRARKLITTTTGEFSMNDKSM